MVAGVGLWRREESLGRRTDEKLGQCALSLQTGIG